MASADDLLGGDTWLGGEYELAVLLGPRDDDRLEAAATALWRLAGFTRGTPPTRASLAASEPARGVVEPLPGRPLAAQVSAMRIEEPDAEDWLFLDLPLGALSHWDPAVGAFPFGPEGGEPSRTWREPVEDWLVGIGRTLFAEVPYVRAITGWEASALDDEESGHHAVLRNADGRLDVTPVTRWSFGGPA
jgi:hypothetical protein